MDLTDRPEKSSTRPDALMPWLLRELVITLVGSAVLALVLQFVLVSFGTAAHLIGTWAVCAVGVLAFRVHAVAMPISARKQAKARSSSRTTDARNEASAAAQISPGKPQRAGEQWFDPLPPTLVHRFARLYRHVDRLSYAVVAPRHYESGVQPVLAELARDRIRRHHGIDLNDEPERARAVLGEDLCRALTTPVEQAPTTEDLDRWLTQLERLDRS